MSRPSDKPLSMQFPILTGLFLRNVLFKSVIFFLVYFNKQNSDQGITANLSTQHQEDFKYLPPL